MAWLCLSGSFARAGLGYRWGGSVDVMGDSCDVGPYRAVRSAAVAAQQGRSRITLPDEAMVALRVEGRTAPPKLVIRGPGGRRIVSPSEDGQIEKGRYAIAEEPAERATHVVIARVGH